MEKQIKPSHVTSVPLDDYWKEFSSFEETGHPDDEDDDAFKTPDEGEIEEEWLREAGFPSLEDSDVDTGQKKCLEDMLATLTARQRAVVQKRLDTVQMSKKRRYLKNKQRADVRDVFINKPSSVPSENNGEHISHSQSLPKNYQHNFQEAVQIVPQVQHYHKNSSRLTSGSSVLPPLLFLRTGHSGGFSLLEHSKAIDSESQTSVEVLSYASRRSVQEREPYHNGDRSKKHTSNQEAPKTSFQEISSRLTPEDDDSISGPESLNSVSSVSQNVEISDLSEEDRTAVRTLSIIETAALLDSYGLVPSRRRKPNRKKRKDGTVFGVSLTSLLELDKRRCPGLKIPLVYQWILHHLHSNGLHEVGLMRLGGSIQKTEALKHEIEKHYISSPMLVESAIQQSSVHEAAAILKQFIRHLPEPLLTNSHMDSFLQVPNILSVEDQINLLNLLVLTLPDVHRELLQELLYFLAKVVEEEEYNRMTLSNVAMIMAPNLFPPPRLKKRDHKNNDLNTEVTVAALSSKVTQLLIKYGLCLGSVPADLLNQARLQTQHSCSKHMKRVGGRKLKTEKLKLAKEAALRSNGPVIRVQVGSLHPRCGVPIPVDEHTTAGDVIQRVAQALDILLDSRSHSPDILQENRALALARQRPRTASEPVIMRPRCLFETKKPSDCLKDHFLYHGRENAELQRLDHGTLVLGLTGSSSGRFKHASIWELRCHH